MTITTDAILEGRTLALKAPQEFYPLKGTAGDPSASNRRVGFMIQGSHLVGSLATDDHIVAKDTNHDLIGLLCYPASGSIMLRCQAHTDFDLFHGIQMKIWNINGNGELILELDRAERPAATVGGYVHWHVNPDDFAWLVNLPDGQAFGVSFTDTGHNRMVEEMLGKRVYKSGGTHFDIMVTFTEDLHENASKLTVSAEFKHQEPPEGVALVTDKLSRNLGDVLT